MQAGANTYYYHYDGLGSVTEITDDSGSIVENYTYDPFGAPSVTTSTINNRYRFTGREYEEESGLYHYRARAYLPTIGRFMQRDPIGYYGGMNLFAYTLNNPINYLDPDGMLTVPGIGWVDAGENVGQSSLNHWAMKAAQANNAFEGGLYNTLGFFSALWTPCTSDATVTTISVAYGATKLPAGLDFGNISTGLRNFNLRLGNKGFANFGIGDLSKTARELIGQYKKAAINREFPTQYISKTLSQIEKDAKLGIAAAKKAIKLLTNNRFDK